MKGMIFPMRMTKKVTSVVLAVLMVVSMMAVMGVSSASAANEIEYTNASGKVSYVSSLNSMNNGTYKLLADYTQKLRMTPGTFASDVTLDLNGHTLTSQAPDSAVNLARNGSASSPKKFALIDSVGGGKLVCNPDANLAVSCGGNYNDITIKNVTIDGNCVGVLKDHQNVVIEDSTINGGNDFALATNGSSTKNGTITVKNSTLTSNNVAVYLPGDADVTFDNTDVTGSTALYVKGGNVEINGGSFTANGAAADYVYNGNGCNSTGDAIVIENAGSTYTAGPATVTINGGSFESANGDAVSTPVKDTSLPAAEGFIESGDFAGGVDNSYFASGVTSTTYNGVEYVGYDGIITNQSELAAACANGGKYVLGESFTSTGADVADGVDLELNLADKTLTVPAWGFCNYGKLTVDGTTGKITAPKGAIDNYGELILKGGTIEGTITGTTDVTIWNNANTGASVVVDGGAINAGGFGINNEKGCSVTMNSGSITAGNTAIATYDETTVNGGSIEAGKWGISVWGSDADLTVNGGSIEADYFGISGNGSNGNQGYEITVNGGYIQGDEVGIYHPNYGSLEVNGGTIEGATGIYVKAGETAVTAINGATVKGTGAAAAYTYSGNGCNPTGDAVVIDNCGYPGGAPNVSIAGGNFISDNAKAVGSYQTGDYPKITDVVSGGTFSSDVSDVAADGYVGVQNANGTYGVGDDPNPLNALETATVTDDNAFGLNCKYLKGTLLGVQKKTVAGEETSSQEGEKNIRFVAVLDTDLVQDADDYGFVLAKVGTNKTTQTTNFDNLKAYWGNGEKTISAMGTYNNVCGNTAYGDPEDTSTSYKYVTCAVNNVDDNSKIAARFFYKKDGKTYYAKYAAYNYVYTGCTSSADAT